MEFHRAVTDLFPRGEKCLRFMISDFVGRFLTPGWSTGSVISHEQLLNSFASCDLPKAGGDVSSCSILNGILLGLEALSEQTLLQRKVVDELAKMNRNGETALSRQNVADSVRSTKSTEGASGTESNESTKVKKKIDLREEEDSDFRDQLQKNTVKDDIRIRNRGSMVVITTLDSFAEFDAINEYIAEQIVALNESSRISADKKSVPIDHIDLFVLNITLDPKKALFREKRHFNFRSRLISVTAGPALVVGVHKVLQDIYGLASTTVCGIPMKEEAQSGQSINYDVEMLHPRSAHLALASLGLLSGETKMMDSAAVHEQLFTSVRLKWCTAGPKLKTDKFPILQCSFPITPAHVSLRQSVCLTSFITNGKSVLLEVFPDAYQGRAELSKLTPNLHQKLISHYLSRDVNGALLLHCVAMGEKANFGGKLCSEQVYGPKGCAAELAKGLNRTAMAQILQAAQIVPCQNEHFALVEDESVYDDEGEGHGEENGETESVRRFGRTARKRRRRGRHCDEQLHKLELLSHGMPFSVNDSFIYNVPEKFEPLLSTVSKQQIGAEQLAQCKSQIFSLIAERGKEPLTDKVFECKLLAGGRSDLASKDEQFRVAFDELCRVLSRFSHLSESHLDLLTLFCDLSGTRLLQTQKRKRAFSPSNSALAKKAKKDLWEPGEKININDWLRKRYDLKYWSGWKGDFEGRLKYGDKAQEFLYPTLKLPPGQTKYTGTGGAGPIE
uniref:Protein asunder n=1 Tax=Globodera pallida TaxID=36090 RepID=A0A183C913_GLOPA